MFVYIIVIAVNMFMYQPVFYVIQSEIDIS